MSKTPKGLKEFNLEKMFKKDNFDFFEDKLAELFVNLAYEIAEGITGYSTASGLFDGATERYIQKFINYFSSYSSSSDEDEFNKFEYLGNVKEAFKLQINEKLVDSPMIEFGSFKRLHAKLKEEGYEGDEISLEKEIKNSSNFRELCIEITAKNH